MIDAVFGSYSNPLQINGLMLRYIDSIEFDYDEEDIFLFLRKQMKIDLDLHDNLFAETDINRKPSVLDLRLSYPCRTPNGVIHLRFARGSLNETDALIWETTVQSAYSIMPQTKNEIEEWVEQAHTLSRTWFFNLIEGDLYRRFE